MTAPAVSGLPATEISASQTITARHSQRSTGLGSVESVGFGKAADGADYPAIYAVGKYGIQHGVFCSLDAGKTWSRVNDDQHQYGNMGSCITGDPDKFSRLYLATNGRGIIFGDISLSALKSTLSRQAIPVRSRAELP